MQPELNKKIHEILASSEPRRIHFIGVCGSGMSGLARLIASLGHRLSGSDLVDIEQAQAYLPAGLEYSPRQQAANGADADLVIYSSAIAAENEERKAAVERGILTVRRAEALSVLSRLKTSCVISGSHGKTTTTSMLTWVLRQAGLNPSHYVGAQVPLLGANASWNNEGKPFVIEADESDGTLALFHPHASLILNIEEEHLDFFRNIQEIVAVFAKLADQTTGPIVFCADDKNSTLLCSHRSHAISYGFTELAQYRALDVKLENYSSRFSVLQRGQLLGEVRLQIPGRQNVSNALGVIALALEMGVAWSDIVAALAEFRGAARRFEVKYQSAEHMVVDDYAHHPTEILATLAAAKNSGWKRVVALFQPHRYTRTQALLQEFATAFKDADHLIVTDIYAASEAAIPGVSGESIVEVVRGKCHASVAYEPTLPKVRAAVNQALAPGDLVITMGAGDIHKVASDLAEGLGWFHELKPQLKAESILKRDEPMSKHTTLRIGGPAQLWFEPVDEDDLVRGLKFAHAKGIPVTPIGRGSNLLVRDGGIDGLCVHLGQKYFSRIEINGEYMTVGAGARLKNIVSEARRAGLGGIEFMEGIPGNLGGALCMNAGAMQGWTMEAVESIRAVDLFGNVHELKRDQMEVNYRSVPHFQKNMALSARLKGTPMEKEVIAEKLKVFSNKRWTSQPAAPSAGCIFKNPGPIPAGKLIDEIGLKNTAVGSARVSEVHANFIVNDGGATAEDVLQLITIIQNKARETRQIELHTEVVVLGKSS